MVRTRTVKRIKERWEHFDWSLHGNAKRGEQAVKDIHNLLEKLEFAQAETQLARSAYHKLQNYTDWKLLRDEIDQLKEDLRQSEQRCQDHLEELHQIDRRSHDH